MKKLGKNSTSFTIKFEDHYFKQGDIIEASDTIQLKVIKVYKFTWWRRILFKFGFPFKHMDCIRVNIF